MKQIKTFKELPEGYWDFIVEHYPDYYHADEILWNDILTRYCNNELLDKKDIQQLKDDHGFKNMKQAKIALEKEEINLYNIAVDNFNKTHIEIEILYRCGANYKDYFDHVISIEKFPEAINLRIGQEFTMGEYGTRSEDDFFSDRPYNKKFDHNILEIVGIEGEETQEKMAQKFVQDNKLEKDFKSFNEFFDDKTYLYFLEIEHEEEYKNITGEEATHWNKSE
jgi:hypothetical protein